MGRPIKGYTTSLVHSSYGGLGFSVVLGLYRDYTGILEKNMETTKGYMGLL